MLVNINPNGKENMKYKTTIAHRDSDRQVMNRIGGALPSHCAFYRNAKYWKSIDISENIERMSSRSFAELTEKMTIML